MLIIFEDKDFLQITRGRNLPDDILLLSSNDLLTLSLYTDHYDEYLEDWEHSYIGRTCVIEEKKESAGGFKYSAKVPLNLVQLFAGESSDNWYTDEEFHAKLAQDANMRAVWSALKVIELGHPPKIAKMELPLNAFYSDNIDLHKKVNMLKGVLELHGIHVAFDSEGNAEWGYHEISQMEPPIKPI